MKKNLLLIILPVFLFTASLQAQVKVWNFATNTLADYDNVIDTNTKVDAILYAGTGGAIGVSGAADSGNQVGSFGNAASDKVFYVNDASGDRLRMDVAGITAYNTETKSTFSSFFGVDVPWGRLYSNGSGSDTRRFYGFNLAAGEVITIYYYIDNSDLNTVTVDAAGTPSTFEVDNTSAKEGQVYQITAGAAGLYKFYCGTGKLCVGRIYEGDIILTDGVLSNDKVVLTVSTKIQAIGNRVYVSNVKSSTEVSIYSITGALVKSIKTTEATAFSLKQGLYIATVKTLEGQKSVKLLVQ